MGRDVILDGIVVDIISDRIVVNVNDGHGAPTFGGYVIAG